MAGAGNTAPAQQKAGNMDFMRCRECGRLRRTTQAGMLIEQHGCKRCGSMQMRQVVRLRPMERFTLAVFGIQELKAVNQGVNVWFHPMAVATVLWRAFNPT